MFVLPNLHPMRLSRRPKPFDSNDYLFEFKIDGYRSPGYIESGSVASSLETETPFAASRTWPTGSESIFGLRTPFWTAKSHASMNTVVPFSKICCFAGPHFPRSAVGLPVLEFSANLQTMIVVILLSFAFVRIASSPTDVSA